MAGKAFVVYDADDQFVDSIAPYVDHRYVSTVNGRELYFVSSSRGAAVQSVLLPENGTFFIEPIEHEPVVA